MNVDIFVQQIENMYGRLAELYRDASSSPTQQLSRVLPVAYKELGTASEKLQLAAEELLQQNEALATAQSQLELERQRYIELFEFAPDAYLVINQEGVIQEANRSACLLFNISHNYLISKPLAVFVPEAERPKFRCELNLLIEREHCEWHTRLQPRNGEPFEAGVTANHVCNQRNEVLAVRLCVRDITERKRAEAALQKSDYDPRQDRPKHYYSKGEVIPLIPQTLWLVCKGLVKLSTLSENGEEVIVGFAGSSTPFGSSLTALQVYQATALSEVELVCISLTELTISPNLAQTLLPKVNQRLRQTELLLAIAGQRRVKERLERLLMLLKQEIGEPTRHGTRLTVRLTHEELASACCTTRVTITRELNKLQRQGSISLDSDRHLILKDANF